MQNFNIKNKVLKHHRYLDSLPDPKDNLSKTWKKDLKHAIEYNLTEDSIIGIFMNVYLHSKKKYIIINRTLHDYS